MLQDVLGVDISILLSLCLKSEQKKRKGNEEAEKSHGVQGSENKGVRGHNVHLEWIRTCAYKSPMFMPKEKWN